MKGSNIPEQCQARCRCDCQANRERLAKAEASLRGALSDAAEEGFYGEVTVSVTFQDGVAQKVNVENNRVIR